MRISSSLSSITGIDRPLREVWYERVSVEWLSRRALTGWIAFAFRFLILGFLLELFLLIEGPEVGMGWSMYGFV